jgi:hypothetical protein
MSGTMDDGWKYAKSVTGSGYESARMKVCKTWRFGEGSLWKESKGLSTGGGAQYTPRI